MRDSMLVNMSGHDDHHTGTDMNIEHNINFQKVNSTQSLLVFCWC